MELSVTVELELDGGLILVYSAHKGKHITGQEAKLSLG